MTTSTPLLSHPEPETPPPAQPAGWFRKASDWLRDKRDLPSRLEDIRVRLEPLSARLEREDDLAIPAVLAFSFTFVTWFGMFMAWSQGDIDYDHYSPAIWSRSLHSGLQWMCCETTKALGSFIGYLLYMASQPVVVVLSYGGMYYVALSPLIVPFSLGLTICANLSIASVLPFTTNGIARLIDYLILSSFLHFLARYLSPTLILTLDPYLYTVHLATAAVALFDLAPLQSFFSFLAMVDEGTLYSNFKVLLTVERRETADVQAMREELKTLREEVAGLKERSK
ncbi:hypothetical protein JCM11251_004977 [Rhodosporidiobolus azoricus]